MNQCQHCGTVNRTGARFCARCGQGLSAGAAPAAPPARRSGMPLLVMGGTAVLFLLLVVFVWALFLGQPTGQTDGVATTENGGSVTILLPTPTPQIIPTADLSAAEDTPTEPTANPLPLEPTATPLPPEPTPTLAPLTIPGTDIEVPRITDEEEIDIGREIATNVEAQFGVYHNPTQLNRVAAIGQAILPHTDRSHLPYTFTLLDTAEINAFAVPGGFIYVTRGMLDFVRSDDELAGVIGHEIAHVARRHGASRLETFALAEATARRLVESEPRLGDIYATEEGRFATEMTAFLLFNGWSRQQEFEADEYGTIYMARAGYDPQAIIHLFNRMERIFASGDDDALSRLFRTHPPFPDRVQRIEHVIVENGL